MDTRWTPYARDSKKDVRVILHPTASIPDVRKGLDVGVDMSDFVSAGTHTKADCNLTLNWNYELFGTNQPKPGQIIEVKLPQDNIFSPAIGKPFEPVWIGVIESLSNFTLSRGERSLQLVARSRETQDVWKTTKRVTDLYPQLTDLAFIAKKVAETAGLFDDEIIFPFSSFTTPHSNTQLADMTAWEMLTTLFLPMAWTPFFDGLGRLRVAQRDLGGQPNIILTDDQVVKVVANRQRPPASRMRLKWLNPILKKSLQQTKILTTETITMGWFLPFFKKTVYFSADQTQRAQDTWMHPNPSCNVSFGSFELPLIIENYDQLAQNSGRILLLNPGFALSMISLLVSYQASANAPLPVVSGPGIGVAQRNPAESLAMITFLFLMMAIGTGTYEIHGTPFDWVHARNTTEAFDNQAPKWVDNPVDLESDFIVDEQHAQAVSVRELIYQAYSANKWTVQIVDNPQIEYGDILEFPDKSRLYVEDFKRSIPRGSEAILEVSGFLVGTPVQATPNEFASPPAIPVPVGGGGVIPPPPGQLPTPTPIQPSPVPAPPIGGGAGGGGTGGSGGTGGGGGFIPPPGTTWYTAKTGSDVNGDGSIDFPWQTVDYGSTHIGPGDTLYVRDGVYDESLIDSVPSGIDDGTRIHIIAYPGETVILRPSSGTRVLEFDGAQQFIEFDGINLDGRFVTTDTVKINGAGGSEGNAHHINIFNAEIQGPPVDPVGDRSQKIICTALVPGIIGGNKFVNLNIHGGGSSDFDQGFYIQSSDNLVDSCDLWDLPGSGVQLYNGYGPTPDRNIVRNNRIHDFTRSIGQRGQGIVMMGNDNQVYNNVIWNIQPNAGGSAGLYLFNVGTGVQIYNNTITGNVPIGIVIDPGIEAILRNNISFNNTDGDYSNSSGSITADHNLFGVDPLFVNPGAANFTLQAGSVAINAGVTISIVTVDITGLTRPQGSAYCIGAFEFTLIMIRYVSLTGSDGFGDGSIEKPWRTIFYGSTQITSTSTLYVRQGTYVEQLVDPSIASGTDWSHTTNIVAYPGETVWLKPDNPGFASDAMYFATAGRQFIEFDGINVDYTAGTSTNPMSGVNVTSGTFSGTFFNANHMRFKNAEFLGPRTTGGTTQNGCIGFQTVGLNTDSVGFNQFLNLKVHGTAGDNFNYGFYIQDNDNLIESCEFYDLSVQGGQLYDVSNFGVSRNTVTKCKFHDIYQGSALNDTRTAIIIAGNDNLVSDNLIWNINVGGTFNGDQAGIVFFIYNSSKVYNNTIVNTNGYGVLISTGVVGAQVVNNILYGNSAGTIQNNGTGSTTTPNFTSNPNFVNLSSNPPNLHLIAGSGAIDTATVLSEVTDDFDGVSRPQGGGYDYGAYEQ